MSVAGYEGAEGHVSHEEVVKALPSTRWPLFDGHVKGVIVRDECFQLLVSHPRIPEVVAVTYAWPDRRLTGPHTGEPQTSLAQWLHEIDMDLAEMFATETLDQLKGSLDPETGYRVIPLPRPWFVS